MKVKLVKDKNFTGMEGELSLNLTDMIGKMIDFYSTILMDRDKWCTKQERQFLIASIIIGNKDIRYTSAEAFSIYKEVFNIRRQSDVRGLMKRLEENAWLVGNKDTKKIQLLEFFKMNIDSTNVNFNINLKLVNGSDS